MPRRSVNASARVFQWVVLEPSRVEAERTARLLAPDQALASSQLSPTPRSTTSGTRSSTADVISAVTIV